MAKVVADSKKLAPRRTVPKRRRTLRCGQGEDDRAGVALRALRPPMATRQQGASERSLI